MPLFLVLLIYNLLLPFALLVLLPVSAVKMRRRGGYGAKLWQRFGFFDKATTAQLEAGCRRCRWIHAVSVGEVNVARKLIRELQRAEPGIPVVLSVTTSTGYAVASEKAPAGLTVIYSPVDLALVVGPVFARIRPRQFILVEAEVWPNLVRCMQRAGVPVVLVNARLSPRSEKRYRQFRWFVAPVFGMLDRVLAQEPEDVARWEAIGARPGRVEVAGSIKFDQQGQSASSPERVAAFRELVKAAFGGPVLRMILAASTHAGEELALAGMWQEMSAGFPDVRLLIAPRHAERRAEVAAALEGLGLRVVLRSGLSGPGEPSQAGLLPGVLIVDSTGELRDWQALADVVIIGKSFLAKGGQNPAEAIAAGVPVVAGPHMENFSALMKLLLAADGIRQTVDLSGLATVLPEVLRHSAAAQAMALRGKTALARHAGATQRTALVLRLGTEADG
jgi:3-deoxy-D-manno-octulosonic-acid transferase